VKEFSCGQVVPDCDARFQGETEEEVLQQVAVHAKEAHGMDDVPPEVLEQVKAGISEV
jgi:predicted small metal-binding protein